MVYRRPSYEVRHQRFFSFENPVGRLVGDPSKGLIGLPYKSSAISSHIGVAQGVLKRRELFGRTAGILAAGAGRVSASPPRIPPSTGLRTAGMMSKWKWGKAGWFAVAGAVLGLGGELGSQFTKSVRWRPSEKPGAFATGPGFISFAKTQGMPNNHLGTEGIGLSLSNLRHSSIL